MKGGQQQQQSTSHDALWISGFFVCVVAVLWYLYSPQIVAFLFRMRTIEGEFLLPMVQGLQDFLDDLGLRFIDADALKKDLAIMSGTDPKTIGYKELIQISNGFGQYFVIPVVAISTIYSVVVLFGNISSRFNRIYTMKSFRDAEQNVWPVIKPVLNKDLIKVPLNEGVWAMSKTPMMFAKEYNLLEHVTKDYKPAVKLVKGAAHRQFCLQMGPLWKGLESLSPYAQALFAIFAAKGEGDSDGAYNLLYQIARSSGGSSLDYTGTRELLVKHVRSRGVGRAVGPHAYLFTVMASMLEFARSDGVLATGEFLWLKPLDRRMWYMLSSVGRQTPFPEIAGTFGHWMVEKRLRRPLKVPMVGEAVEALDEAIENILYNPDEE